MYLRRASTIISSRLPWPLHSAPSRTVQKAEPWSQPFNLISLQALRHRWPPSGWSVRNWIENSREKMPVSLQHYDHFFGYKQISGKEIKSMFNIEMQPLNQTMNTVLEIICSCGPMRALGGWPTNRCSSWREIITGKTLETLLSDCVMLIFQLLAMDDSRGSGNERKLSPC